MIRGSLIRCVIVGLVSMLLLASAEAGSMDSLLISSIRNNDVEMVKTAIANGANINCIEKGTTPLLTAIDGKKIKMIEFLLHQGADPNLQVNLLGIDKRIPLIQALRSNVQANMTIPIHLLVDAGANVNECDHYGFTPLMVAIQNPPNLDAVQLLIAKKADVNAASHNGTTALMIAANYENGWLRDYRPDKITASKLLLNAGADPNLVDYRQKTALQIAIDTNFKEMITLLLPISPK